MIIQVNNDAYEKQRMTIAMIEIICILQHHNDHNNEYITQRS